MPSMNAGPNSTNIETLHAERVQGTVRETGQWRSLEELAASCEVVTSLPSTHDPKEEDDGEMIDALDRRRFLQLAAASFGLAGLTGCTRQPTERILPYVNAPENLIPGHAKYYATAFPGNGSAEGIIVEAHMGRPTKVEGNPRHPASLGATSVHAQASVLDLYDPDRAKGITHSGEEESWDEFTLQMQHALAPIRGRQGAGLSILTGSVTSPSLGAQIHEILRQFPAAKWHQFEPAGEHGARAGSMLAFGRPVNTLYAFDKAGIVLSLDSDFLACGRNSTRYARDFTTRRVQGDRLDMNRLYVVESTMTPTGGKADHRLPLRYAEVETLARALAGLVGVEGLSATYAGQHAQWIAAVAKDLQANRGQSIVIPGPHQSAAVHALSHAINAALGNVGKTVTYTDPIEAESVDQLASLRDLVNDIDTGQVQMLLMLGGNPVYDAPVDFSFADRLKKVPLSIRIGLHHDETSDLCTWHVPESHFLEDWGDARAFDGTVSIIQPLILPLYDSRSYLQVLDLVLQEPVARSTHEIVQAYWQKQAGAAPFEPWWRKVLHEGVVPNTTAALVTPVLKLTLLPAAGNPSSSDLELVFRPDAYMHDGRYANNAWLQELPQPMTKLTWDNAVYLSPATARKLSLVSQNRVSLRHGGESLEAGVWVMPGHPDGSATVHLGWGRWAAGRAGNGAGFSAYRIRRSDAMWSGQGVQLVKVDSAMPLATTQLQQTMEGRDIVLHGELDGYKSDPDFVKKKSKEPPKDLSLYPVWEYKGNAWGMSIDLNRCVNCNACIVACQAENNIPVVGKKQVLARRAMHWLRIDTYYEGDPDNPKAYFQPVPCMHCEKAPCEVVCPVQATQHSFDGLNDMVYNRCVGTRYCSNNCPYKVRRFNFLLYQDWTTESIKLQRNPDVTVRSRGVMEKCTYCVQRIREAEIRSQVEGRYIREGEVKTACQQSCPTDAIVFGNINDAHSEVAKRKAENLNYALLAELNTRPRTTYTAVLRNPNPELEQEKG